LVRGFAAKSAADRVSFGVVGHWLADAVSSETTFVSMPLGAPARRLVGHPLLDVALVRLFSFVAPSSPDVQRTNLSRLFVRITLVTRMHQFVVLCPAPTLVQPRQRP
jgi:hypothetical protein